MSYIRCKKPHRNERVTFCQHVLSLKLLKRVCRKLVLNVCTKLSLINYSFEGTVYLNLIFHGTISPNNTSFLKIWAEHSKWGLLSNARLCGRTDLYGDTREIWSGKISRLQREPVLIITINNSWTVYKKKKSSIQVWYVFCFARWPSWAQKPSEPQSHNNFRSAMCYITLRLPCVCYFEQPNLEYHVISTYSLPQKFSLLFVNLSSSSFHPISPNIGTARFNFCKILRYYFFFKFMYFFPSLSICKSYPR